MAEHGEQLPVADPSSPTGVDVSVPVNVVVADEQADLPIDTVRWAGLATSVLQTEQRGGELTLTFVDRSEIAVLNELHLGQSGPTDVLSFPLDDDPDGVAAGPVLLGDVVICPAVAAANAPGHAGTLDDELALLVVHGILHVLGHDHVEHADTRRMRDRELELLERHHWVAPAPASFSQEHSAS